MALLPKQWNLMNLHCCRMTFSFQNLVSLALLENKISKGLLRNPCGSFCGFLANNNERLKVSHRLKKTNLNHCLKLATAISKEMQRNAPLALWKSTHPKLGRCTACDLQWITDLHSTDWLPHMLTLHSMERGFA